MRVLMTIAVVPVAVSAAISADATPLWQLILRHQMMADQRCHVANLSDILERQIGERITLMAKVHCNDGRQFHAEWNLEERRFRVHPEGASPAVAAPTKRG